MVRDDRPSAKYPPNTRLSWQRLQRGWSREELVEQIRRSMAAEDEIDSGLNAETVRRWEAGQRWPEPRYRKHLVLLFDLPANDLGLLTPDELALRPDSPTTVRAARAPDARTVDAIVRKVVQVLYEDETAFDQDKLAGLLRASTAPLASHGLAAPVDSAALSREPGSRPDARAVDAYAEITSRHRELYWQSPAGELLPSAVAHAQLGAGMLRAATSGEHAVKRLAGALSESALLVARLAFFDLGRIYLAEQAFGLAEDAVETSGNHALAAAVLAHRAFVPGFAGRAQPAVDYLSAAQAHSRYDAGPLLRAWLHCVEAEIGSRTGLTESSLDRIRTAEDALTSNGHDPAWLDYFNPSRLAGFAGNALLLAGKHRAAVAQLETALRQAADHERKQQPVLLFDLATAQAATDAAQALATAASACDLLDQDWYATALDRVPAVRAALQGTPHAAELEDRVQALAGDIEN